MTIKPMSRLAILGGPPSFAEPLHVGRPNMGNREQLMERIEDILDRRWFTNNGPYVQEFEKKVADLCEVQECVATCNGTIALEILMRAVGLEGEVIVPAFTFVATAHALQWQEIRPVFCDVDPETHTLDPRRVEELITPNTTGIVGVHLWGGACDTEALQEIADRHGLKLIYDASHGFGCTHAGRPLGGFGDGEVFSFHATKVINTFEGGAILTNDKKLADQMRLMRNFGFVTRDEVDFLGSNGKMSEISAAMGLTGLESMGDVLEANRRNHARYTEQLGEIPGLRVLQPESGETSNHHYVVVEVDAERTGLERDELVKVLEAENVLARRYFYPGVHRMEPYRSYQPMAGLVLPETERLCTRVMVLPTGQTVSDSMVDQVVRIIAVAIQQRDAVKQACGSEG